MKQVIFNRETSKIELHFEKSEYQALTDKERDELKRAFQWSRYAGAWVSRSTQDHYWAKRVAASLGFDVESMEKTGERLSFAEMQDRKVEKAEARAERMEEHAENAEKRGQQMQAEMNSYHGDIAFFTQPNINSSAGRAFTNRRQRILDRYAKGFDEYRKSEYFRGRAETARETAEMGKMKDRVYLDTRIKECAGHIKKLTANMVSYDETMHRIESGEEVKSWDGHTIQAERLQAAIDECLDKIEYQIDKQAYYQNALDELGGIQFSRENIKPGYIVDMKRWGKCEIISAGPVNVQYKILTGGAAGLGGVEPYAAIEKILAVYEAQEIKNPYTVGDLLYISYFSGGIRKAFEVLKVTEKGIQIQEVAIENGVPQAGKYKPYSKPERKGITQSKFNDYIGAYYDGRQLYTYTEKAAKEA
jgi:hypothetical protein